jgi:pantoate kinase
VATVITSAVTTDSTGTVVAELDRITIGGGVRTVTVDGIAEDRTYDVTTVYHVRLLSQAGRQIPDELVEAATYDDAVALAEAFATKCDENADKIAALRQALA